MVLPNPLFRRQITEHIRLLMIDSAHILLLTECAVELKLLFQHTARNLKVLPRDLSGQQVNDLMKGWSFSLGVRCDACHAEATETIAADDDSNLNYADDSKQMKIIARNMYIMTEEINNIHIAKLGGSGMPVTCGTCHRGHISPEPFVAAPQDVSSSSARSTYSTSRY